ncbi:hypothetical protein CQJ28_18585 [Escherichia sp. E2562]|nr:hypothetical protein CQJ28_18585 [Escherichia sp. E2562]
MWHRIPAVYFKITKKIYYLFDGYSVLIVNAMITYSDDNFVWFFTTQDVDFQSMFKVFYISSW